MPIEYMCDTDSTPASPSVSGVCGAGDPKLPPEPHFPTDAQVCQTLTAAKGCEVEFAMKDVHTLANQPWRLGRWVKLAREVIGEFHE